MTKEQKLREEYIKYWGVGKNNLQSHVVTGLNIQYLESIKNDLNFLANVKKEEIKKELASKTIKELEADLVDFKEEIKDLKTKKEFIDFYIEKKF